jgi:hypothetical protein
MTKKEKEILRKKNLRKDRIYKITRLRTEIINNLIDDEIYLENVDYMIEDFLDNINEYLKEGEK